MKMNETDDPMLRLLGRLPYPKPVAGWDDRVRSRCHFVLARQQHAQSHRRERPIHSARILTALLVITAVIYAAATTLEAMRLARLLS